MCTIHIQHSTHTLLKLLSCLFALQVEKIFVEGGAVLQNSEADPFEVSDADTMVKYLESAKK